MNYKAPDGNIWREYTKFRSYRAPCGITWIPLQVGDKQVKWFADSNVSEVVSPFETGMLYDKPELPPRSIVVWTPVITLTPSMAAQVNHAIADELEAA